MKEDSSGWRLVIRVRIVGDVDGEWHNVILGRSLAFLSGYSRKQ